MDLPDLHIHTTMSDGELDLKKVVKLAKRNDIAVGICDHISIYHQVYNDYAFEEYIAELRRYEVFAGGELDINATIPVSEDSLQRLDYISAGTHHYRDKQGDYHYYFGGYPISDPEYAVEEHLERVEDFLHKYHVDILVHPTMLPPQLVPLYYDLWNDSRVDRLLSCAVETDTMLEISGHWKVPTVEILREALNRGITFATGSDSHRKSNLFDLEYPRKAVTEVKIPDERLFRPERK